MTAPDSATEHLVQHKVLAKHMAAVSRDFGLSQEDQSIVASVCSTWVDPETILDAAAGPKIPLGQFLSTTGKISHADLNEILSTQTTTGLKIGELVVAKGLASTTEITALLSLQQRLAATPKENRPERLGNLLLRAGNISAEQLEEAVLDRSRGQRRIGEVLVARGYATPSQIERGLKLQSALAALAFLAALVLWSPSQPAAASSMDVEAGKSKATAAIDIGIRISSFLRVTKLEQPATLTIEPKDIALGYIVLSAKTQLAIMTNSRNGFLVNFQGHFDGIRKIQVEGLAQAVEIDADIGSASVPVRSSGIEEKYGLSYRFTLAPDARPGIYPWPVTISASSSS